MRSNRATTLTSKAPIGRIGKPDEAARAIVFLASSSASFVTGQIVTIDGGKTAPEIIERTGYFPVDLGSLAVAGPLASLPFGPLGAANFIQICFCPAPANTRLAG